MRAVEPGPITSSTHHIASQRAEKSVCLQVYIAVKNVFAIHSYSVCLFVFTYQSLYPLVFLISSLLLQTEIVLFRSASLDCSESLQSSVRSGYLWPTTSILSHRTLIHGSSCCVWGIFTRLSSSTHVSSWSSVPVNAFSAWSTSHRNTWSLLETLCIFQSASR